MKISFILFTLLFSSVAAFAGNGHIGVMGGYGALSSSSWPVTSYGATVAARGARGGELALNYLNNSVQAPPSTVTLQMYELDLRHAFSEKYGFYIGLPIFYLGSSNENVIPSGVNMGAQLGYDLGMGDHFSIGVRGQATLIRNFYLGLLNLKIW